MTILLHVSVLGSLDLQTFKPARIFAMKGGKIHVLSIKSFDLTQHPPYPRVASELWQVMTV